MAGVYQNCASYMICSNTNNVLIEICTACRWENDKKNIYELSTNIDIINGNYLNTTFPVYKS